MQFLDSTNFGLPNFTFTHEVFVTKGFLMYID